MRPSSNENFFGSLILSFFSSCDTPSWLEGRVGYCSWCPMSPTTRREERLLIFIEDELEDTLRRKLRIGKSSVATTDNHKHIKWPSPPADTLIHSNNRRGKKKQWHSVSSTWLNFARFWNEVEDKQFEHSTRFTIGYFAVEMVYASNIRVPYRGHVEGHQNWNAFNQTAAPKLAIRTN